MADLAKDSRIPTKWFNNMLKSLEKIEHSKQLVDVIMDIKKQFGFYSITYCLVISNNFRSEDYYIYSDESPEWKQTYLEKQYWKTDTRIILARKRMIPFRWSELKCRADFISNEIMKGVLDGMTIPVHGPHHVFGFLHFTYAIEQRKITSWLQYIQPFVVCLAQHLTEAKFKLIQKGALPQPIYHNPSKAMPVVLSEQQRKCLVWVAEGKSTEEIALILGISVSTVNKHLDSAAKLLNTNSRAHTIAKVVDGKLIGLEYKKKSNIFYI